MANLPDTRWNSSTVLIAAPGKAIKRERDDSAEPPPERKRARITRKECIICVDDVAANQFPKKPHAGDDEQHTSDVCFKCYNQHISTGVDHKGSELVRCPQCLQTLTEPEVRKLARVATYQKWEFPTPCNIMLFRMDLLTSEQDTSTTLRRNACRRRKSSMPARTLTALGVLSMPINFLHFIILT
jgi:hypothetical protein